MNTTPSLPPATLSDTTRRHWLRTVGGAGLAAGLVLATTPEVRRAAEGYALALQGLMEAEDRQGAFEAAQAVNKSISCIYERLPGNADFQLRRDMLKDIKEFTANTQERFTKYWDSNARLAGATFRRADGSACESLP